MGIFARTRRFLRKALSFLAVGLFVAIVFGVVGEFFIEWAREKKLYENPSQKVDAMITAFIDFVTSTWFIGATAALAIFAAGFWVDGILRRREERESGYFNPELFTYDPQDQIADKQAYFDLMDFALYCLLPACDRQYELQKKMIRHLIPDSRLAELAIEGLQYTSHPGTQSFWIHYNNLIYGIDSSEATIKYGALIDCIKGLEKNGYQAFCNQADELSKPHGLDYKTDVALAPVWEKWRQSHNTLVKEYERIKRDPRFPRLFKPRRPSRWGEIIPPISPEA